MRGLNAYRGELGAHCRYAEAFGSEAFGSEAFGSEAFGSLDKNVYD